MDNTNESSYIHQVPTNETMTTIIDNTIKKGTTANMLDESLDSPAAATAKTTTAAATAATTKAATAATTTATATRKSRRNQALPPEFSVSELEKRTSTKKTAKLPAHSQPPKKRNRYNPPLPNTHSPTSTSTTTVDKTTDPYTVGIRVEHGKFS